MKYIDSEKLYEYLEQVGGLYPRYADNIVDNAVSNVIGGIKTFIASLQQDQPKGNLEYWLEHFGMPKENIDNCITQIAQGYGACRYLEGIQHGAEAVNELAKQEQPEVHLAEEITKFFSENPIPHEHITDWPLLKNTALHFFNLGLNAKKKD